MLNKPDQFKVIHTNNNTVEYYTTEKCSTFTDDNGYFRSDKDKETVYAKAIKETKGRWPGKHFRYYIKIDQNKMLIDPTETYSVQDKSTSFINKVCKDISYKEVNRSIFETYKDFLKTGNKSLLLEANRAIQSL